MLCCFLPAALNPAQRAAQAALLDSPLRPISCPTWPGFLPVLPASMEPTFYRWRDTDPPAAAAVTDAEVASTNSGSGTGQAAASSQQAVGTTAAQVVTSAAMLAMLGAFVAPGAAGLLPVVLVTSGSAAAGLLLAAGISGVSGLVDKRQGAFDCHGRGFYWWLQVLCGLLV